MPEVYLNSQDFLGFIKDAETTTIKLAMRKALAQSSGKYSSKRLAALGHPYAVRNLGAMSKLRPTRLAVPYGDPAKINMQTHQFYLDWRWYAAKSVGDSLVSQITNIAPYADELEKGIPNLTIPRPLIEKILPNVLYWREKNLLKAIADAIRAQRA